MPRHHGGAVATPSCANWQNKANWKNEGISIEVPQPALSEAKCGSRPGCRCAPAGRRLSVTKPRKQNQARKLNEINGHWCRSTASVPNTASALSQCRQLRHHLGAKQLERAQRLGA